MQSVISVDDIFNGVVPHNICIFFIKQKALVGSYNENGAYLSHCNMSSLRLDLNGNTISSYQTSFPKQFANVFHHTLFNLKGSSHLLTHQNFKQGRAVYMFDLSSSDCCDDLKIEKSGNVRLNVQLDRANEENVMMFVIGTTTGLIEIDSSRRVKTSYLM